MTSGHCVEQCHAKIDEALNQELSQIITYHPYNNSMRWIITIPILLRRLSPREMKKQVCPAEHVWQGQDLNLLGR